MNQYQTGSPRVGAVVIDNFIIQIAQIPFVWLFRADITALFNAVGALVVCLLPVGYSVFMHGRFGQTLGKFFCGVKVLTLNGSRITYEHAIRREIVPCLLLPIWIWTFGYLAIYREYPPSGMFLWAQQICLFWGVLELITMFFNEQRRAIHDFIAKTVVVRVKRPL